MFHSFCFNLRKLSRLGVRVESRGWTRGIAIYQWIIEPIFILS
ncbi:hypothetical protein CWATWH8502_727 [Crocosphaera watsonii WH 8502]|uniref:Uncharacterized protein n=1 Tax=Crocosphaera watsonii WH 8502 TaxID=423474 RepID=T2I9E5_CROWT|nr:hypothetical protein CWATWH8502_727 [Crocosphaera watsonii WH 8502]